MPRRVLALLTLVVLAVHAWVLQGLPLGGGRERGAPVRMAFHTRTLPPPPTPVPAPEAPADAAAAPAQPPAAAAKPKPRPVPARKPAAPKTQTPPQTPEPSPAADDTAPADTSQTAPTAMAQAATPGPEGTDSGSPDTPIAAAAPPAVAASAASAPQEAPAAPLASASASADPAQDSSAGVDIRPPGAGSNTASTTPPPARLPDPVRLEFEVNGQAKKFNYRASAELLWRHDDTRYEARQEIKAFLIGARSQTSTGQVTASGLQPERFGDKARSEQAAHFNFGQGRVTFSANTPQAAIGAGAQDRLSVFIQLGALLAAAPERYPDGTQITLTTVGARYADRWTFTVEGTEMLDLPRGATPALKLQRLPRKEYDQKAELWLAPSLGFLPARIRITQSNGDFADLRLSANSPP
ncbi:DUF3108 domain-containing protein [Paracidovorax valerianellae]|uniref:DUF3108 domain-containing protein n=1 Tax=Paracidovorax valerianellae TaxID=187868 RepID=A0A1G6ZI70_9BURK|nr:DUF3108 domain-containing protein [Paracidovorax valerianellae]MDA8444320.1 DUF3108 domain-containing protein [Paracidovorax valerianellae]SDE02230.1 Protein of unknown function [Paracidovorax valerianellae]